MSVAHRQCAWAQALLSELCRLGVQTAVIAPGSRHTPLVLAAHNLAAAGHLKLYDVLDERVAGFMALGLGRVSGSPTVVLTTSGSAGAHLLPAVIEADRSRVPLIAITADRPARLQGVGAPQTIDQRDLFGVHTRGDEHPTPLEPKEPAHRLAARVMERAQGDEPGPIHVNVPFEKPLWVEGADPLAPTELERASAARPPGPTLQDSTLQELARTLQSAERGLVVVGPGDPGHARGFYGARRDEQADAARRLAKVLRWPLIADGASPARLLGSDPDIVTSLESLVRSGELDEVHPEIILRVGQIATSTTIQGWLATRRSRTIPFDPSGRRQDPAGVCDAPVTADPATALQDLAERVQSRAHDTRWSLAWREAETLGRQALSELAETDEPWSGAVVRAVLERLPEGGLIHVASSLPVRDLDAFSGAPNRRLHVASNRGANGIDGLISTALGEALSWGSPVVCLIGDLAFTHDLGGLAAAREILDERSDASMTLVVLDNGGGAIFDALPIAEHPTAHEPRFVTPKGLEISGLASALGIEHRAVSGTRPEVSGALGEILEAPGLKILHVTLDRREDAARRAEAHDRVRAAVTAAQPWSEVSR